MAGIVVRSGARILRGHDWVYSSEILKTFGDPEPGSVISLKDGRDRALGSAIYNPRSQIVARRFSRRRQGLDDEFFARRLRRALDWRAQAGCRADLCRMVWGEADGLPGVVADRYADVAVLQTNTLAMDMRKATIARLLVEIAGVAHVIERNDSQARAAEGLPVATGTLEGSDPGPRTVEAAGVRFEVDFASGQKTGLYLDQVENWRTVASFANGAEVLDVFSNQGGFALACAAAGAARVTAVESGAAAAARIRANAALNGLEVETLQEDAFRALDAMARDGRAFDLVILDPPSFTRAKGQSREALRGYRDLHRRTAPLLRPGGLLATFCCSHHVGIEDFQAAVADGFGDAKRSAHLLSIFSQPADHPVALHLPETAYLKGLLLAARPGF